MPPHTHPEHGAVAATRASSLDIGDIFRRHQHQARLALGLTPRQVLVMQRVADCRTATLGGHLEVCTHCGFERPAYNSCRDRHCPKCQATRQAKWVAARLERIVPVAHFHVVFTLPGHLRPFAAANPALAYDMLFRAAAHTLMTFGHDPRWLGAQLGVTIILHTWRRDLRYHPHVHCVVTAGGLSDDGERWVRPARGPRFLFPVAALAKVFRGKFLDALAAHDQSALAGLPSDPAALDKLLDRLHRERWHVYAKQPLGGGQHLFKYLGRYTHRVAISNQRLIDVTDTTVTFATKDGHHATLGPVELIQRFLRHVLPEGFTKIRHYGLYAGANVNGRLATAQRLIAGPDPAPATRDEVSGEDILTLLFGPDFLKCPVCKVGRMRLMDAIPAVPLARGPP